MERLTGKQAQSMMEAVASIYEKKEDCVDKDKKTKHNCAKKVCHKEHGEGACIPGKHTLLQDGTVTHYSVVFEHGVEEMIPVEDLEVLVTEMHEHAEMEGEDLQEVDLGKLYKTVVGRITGSGKPPGKTGSSGPITAGGGAPEEDGQVDRYRQMSRERARKKQNNMESADLFDIVKGHLIDEGLTEEEALKKMLTLTDEERSEIIEGSCGSKKDKKKKGGYGK